MEKNVVGEGVVKLVASPNKGYTDLAGRICRSQRSYEELIAAPHSEKMIEIILNSGHLAATEFDFYVFYLEGFSRVTETQLVRKRMASYIMSSSREDRQGKTKFKVTMPKALEANKFKYKSPYIDQEVDADFILDLIEGWYNEGIKQGIKEEDLRYLKPEGTQFRGLVGMNAHALLDFFNVRCCKRAQAEIRDLAYKMLKLCKEDNPALFKHAGPSCVKFMYCPEAEKHPDCTGILSREEAKQKLRDK